jgi:hypothetical protein
MCSKEDYLAPLFMAISNSPLLIQVQGVSIKKLQSVMKVRQLRPFHLSCNII